MSLSHRYSSVSQAVIAACRARWPHHTAKHMARKWGRAVVTTKLWLSKGIPAYQIHTILADLDDELSATIDELEQLHGQLRRTRLETTAARIGSAPGATRRQGIATTRPEAPE